MRRKSCSWEVTVLNSIKQIETSWDLAVTHLVFLENSMLIATCSKRWLVRAREIQTCTTSSTSSSWLQTRTWFASKLLKKASSFSLLSQKRTLMCEFQTSSLLIARESITETYLSISSMRPSPLTSLNLTKTTFLSTKISSSVRILR